MKKSLTLFRALLLVLCASVAVNSYAQNILSESFDGTTFPPTGWTDSVTANTGSCCSPVSPNWTRQSSDPYGSSSPHSGTGMAMYNSYSYEGGSSAELRSPAFNITSQGGLTQVSFWYYGPGYQDKVQVWLNTVPNSYGNNALLLGTITSGTSAWVKYSYALPTTSPYNTSTNYIIIKGVSNFGEDQDIDDFSIDILPCTPAITAQPVNTTVCQNFPATLSVATLASTTPTYQWYKNGVAISGATNATYTVAHSASTDAGSYYVTATGSCGTSTSSSATITVVAPPPAIAVAGGNTTFCPGGNVTLNANTGTGIYYQWKMNGTVIPSNANGASYTASTAGNYTVVTSNAFGCLDTSNAVTVSTLSAPAPTLTTASTPTFCNGGSVSLVANTGNGLHYQWLQNGNNVGGDSSNYTATTSGSYTVTETGANGCTATFPTPVSVVVNGPSAATVSAGGATTFCLGNSVALNANTGSGYTYQWNLNGTAIQGATNASYQAAANGNYTVTITAQSCPLTSAPLPVTVNSAPTNVTTNGTIICTGNTIVMNAPTGPGTLTYLWKKGNANATGVNTTSTYSTNVPGTYSVIVSNGTCTDTSAPIVLTQNTPPPAYITSSSPNNNFCPGNNVILTANSGATLTYQWLDNGTPISGATGVSYIADTTGNYKVIVANGSCADTSQATVATEIPLPVPVISSASSTTFCTGGSVTLSTGTGSGLSYQWMKDGQALPNNTGATYTTGVSGSYNVQVTNNTGCADTAAMPVQVNVYTYPTAAISIAGGVSDSICSGNTLNLFVPNTVGYTYQWQLNNLNLPGAVSPSFGATIAGNYGVTVNNHGCITTSPVQHVTVLALPIATISVTGSTTVCNGDSVHINGTTTPDASYQWLLNNGNISNANSNNYAAYATGDYKLRVTDTNGCAATSNDITVSMVPVPQASVTSQGNSVICQGSTVELDANAGTGLSYQWKLNGSPISGATNASYNAYQTGSYSVTVYDGACNASSSGVNVTVSPLPSNVITVVGQNSHTEGMVCIGGQTELTVPAGNGYSYQWTFDGSNISGGNSSSLNVSDSGTYGVTVVNNDGCTSIGNQTAHISLYPEPNPHIIQYGFILTTGTFTSYQWYRNNAAIPGATGNSYQVTSTGSYKVHVVDSNGCSEFSSAVQMEYTGVANVTVSSDLIRIYPNPAQSIVNVDAPVAVDIRVTSLDGKVVISSNDAKSVDLTNLANGMYMISVYDHADHTPLKVDKMVKTSN